MFDRIGRIAVAIAAASSLGAASVVQAQQPGAAPTAQAVPGSAAPAAVKKVTAEAKAEAVVPDMARTPLAIKVEDPNLQWGACPPMFPEGCRIAVLHGNPAAPGADVFFQVPGGYTIPAHWHTSAERMVLLTGELEVTYQGRSPVVLVKGQYAYGPAKAPHGAKCRSQEPCTLFIAFDLPVDAVAFDGKL
ncbi:MAG TPA: cupin domain-containing protein [Steroidobacteraceae bacterium]|jgi:quercetin dioxygenase-like cupin family protein|nr:cupin domain-containing protein [Steroidobacteraceae bacterium]